VRCGSPNFDFEKLQFIAFFFGKPKLKKPPHNAKCTPKLHSLGWHDLRSSSGKYITSMLQFLVLSVFLFAFSFALIREKKKSIAEQNKLTRNFVLKET
jgi:hypothetical protein